MVGYHNGVAQGGTNAFIPAKTFAGVKPGFFFGQGPQGLGYYLDTTKASGEERGHESVVQATGGRHAMHVHRTGEELLEEAEAAAGAPYLHALDLKALNKLATTLQRKYNNNVEQRAKHADDPQKFLESELDLDEAVKAMTVVAAAPNLYPDLVDTGVIPTFISLLYHENGDVAADTIELLSELTDTDAVEDSEESAALLVNALLKAGLLDALTQRLASLDEGVPEEAAAVYNALSTLENAIELVPEFGSEVASQPGLLDWMISRMRPKAATDGNKEYAAEVLAMVLQAGGEAARKRFLELNGVELTLRAVAPYKSREATTAEEEEFVENAFVALCAVLMEGSAKTAFVEAEGAELMVLLLKSRTAAIDGALKCLDFATTGCPAACDQVVDFGGLGTVFSLFMGKLKPKSKKERAKRNEATLAEEEERCLSVVCNLMSGVRGPERRARVAAKFVENEFEKCDRLMEILARYESRVARIENDQLDGNVSEDALLLERLDAGLFTLQQACLVAAELWALGDVGLRRRILALLHQRGQTLAVLRSVLLEYRATIGEKNDTNESTAAEGERVTNLLVALGFKEEEIEKDGEGIGKRPCEGEIPEEDERERQKMRSSE